jgi:Uma2 family endonuclease
MSTISRAAGRIALSVEEYLRLEEASLERNEYVAGQIYALAGASLRHNRILGNIFGRLWAVARGGPCRVYAAEVKLRAADDVIYYPDVMVACGSETGHPLLEHAPCLVVEVISPSTGAIDRREKLAAYKRLPSLQAYLIVDQDQRRVERYWREEGEWWEQEIAEQGVVPIPCPATQLSLEEIYEGV